MSQDIVKNGEWEMTAKKDDYLLIAYRDYANESQSTSYTHQQSECIANEVTLITNLPVETLVDRLLDQTEQTSCNESSLNLGIAPLSDTTKTSSINQTQSTTAPTTTTTTTTNITSNTTSTITNTSTASNTSTRTTASYSPTPILLPLQIDPENDMFATHLREFVEYQKVYGEGWVTGFKVSCKIHKDYDTGVWSTCKMKMRLTEIGLIPKAMIHTLKK